MNIKYNNHQILFNYILGDSFTTLKVDGNKKRIDIDAEIKTIRYLKNLFNLKTFIWSPDQIIVIRKDDFYPTNNNQYNDFLVHLENDRIKSVILCQTLPYNQNSKALDIIGGTNLLGIASIIEQQTQAIVDDYSVILNSLELYRDNIASNQVDLIYPIVSPQIEQVIIGQTKIGTQKDGIYGVKYSLEQKRLFSESSILVKSSDWDHFYNQINDLYITVSIINNF